MKPVNRVLFRVDRSEEEISLLHSYNDSQLDWFRAGSALNMLHSIAPCVSSR